MAAEQEFRLFSLAGIALSFGVFVAIVATYSLYKCIHNLYFHPLAHIPGPFWARATPIPQILGIRQGNMVPWIRKLHETYGEVVRVAPTEVSFISGATAWQDIYGFRTSKTKSASYQKDVAWYPVPIGGAPAILISDDENHARMRKNLSHAFSDRALRDQEPGVQHLVNSLIQRLGEQVEQPAVDMVMWYNYATFDIITALTFGEPVHCLRDRGYHPWVELVLKLLKSIGKMAIWRLYPMVKYFDFTMLMLKRTDVAAVMRARDTFAKAVIEKVDQRMEIGEHGNHADFFTPIIKNQGIGEKALTRAEMYSLTVTLMAAGSETTATLLSGLTFLIATHPAVYAQLVAEIRGKFASAQDITFDSTARLEYTAAVLQEALRFYPPVPTGFPRMVPAGGDTISGHYIPEGTSVYVSQHAANHSTMNFVEPDSFAPERWMKDAPAKYAEDNHAAMNAFSFGPRNCLGKNLAYAEMRVILAKVLWHFDLELRPESRDWLERNKLFMLLEKPPLMVKLTRVER